jgi:hypothetical protein
MFRLCVAILILLSFPELTIGQNSTDETVISVPVVDKSPGGSPLAISGTFWLAERVRDGMLETSQDAEVLARNITSKPIVVLVCSFTGDGSDNTIHFEYFLSLNLFEPGATDEIVEKRGLWTTRNLVQARAEGQAGQKTVPIEVRFVQFEDGSIFGDRKSAGEYLAARYKAWQGLQELKQVYVLRGEQEFASTLKNTVNDLAGLYAHTLRETQKNEGTPAAFEKLNRMLALGEKRRQTMGAAAFAPGR